MTSLQPVSEAVASAPRPRLPSAGIAAATLWLPCLFALGIVLGSPYALVSYFKLLVVLPGMFVPILCSFDDSLFVAAAVLTTMAAYAVLYVGVRHLSLIPMRIMVAVTAALVGAEAVVIGGLLRA